MNAKVTVILLTLFLIGFFFAHGQHDIRFLEEHADHDHANCLSHSGNSCTA